MVDAHVAETRPARELLERCERLLPARLAVMALEYRVDPFPHQGRHRDASIPRKPVQPLCLVRPKRDLRPHHPRHDVTFILGDVMPGKEVALESVEATLRPGPVAQWIERQTSNLRAEVRLLPGPWRTCPSSTRDFERASGPAVVGGYRRGNRGATRGRTLPSYGFRESRVGTRGQRIPAAHVGVDPALPGRSARRRSRARCASNRPLRGPS